LKDKIEAMMPYFHALFWNPPGMAEENNKKTQ
jgi:hypothetical protein